jgi:hypothetical protein
VPFGPALILIFNGGTAWGPAVSYAFAALWPAGVAGLSRAVRWRGSRISRSESSIVFFRPWQNPYCFFAPVAPYISRKDAKIAKANGLTVASSWRSSRPPIWSRAGFGESTLWLRPKAALGSQW